MSQPQVAQTGDGYVFSWSDLPVTVQLSRIRESTRGTNGEILIEYQLGNGKTKTVTQQAFNLLSTHDRLARELHKRQEAPWEAMLEQVRVRTLRELRKGEPIESLTPTEDSGSAWFVLNPLLYDQNPTILYGPGDSLKSLFALYCGLLLASGVSDGTLSCSPEPRKVLFLDWEMSVDDLRGRVKLFQAGDPRLTSTPDYRRCTQPLASELASIRKVVMEEGYEVLILDSLAMAAGGEDLKESGAAIQFHAALRALNCTSLIIGHTPKPHEEQKERSLYGSVFFQNLCRVSWECRREGQTIGLYQKKNNLGPKHDPLGFHIEIHQEACRITVADLTEEPLLNKALPLHQQLAAVLQKQRGQTAKALAIELGEKEATVRTMLNRYKQKFIAVDGQWECLA